MTMLPLPKLLPGCMVVWFDWDDSIHYALVIQYTENLSLGVFELTIVTSQRVKTLSLKKADQNVKWRVLHAA